MTNAYDVVHILAMLSPVILLLLHLSGWSPPQVVALTMFFGFALVPHVWIVAGSCPLTQLSRDSGGLTGSKTTSAFSEKYFAWLYFPFLRLFGSKVTDQSMRVAVSIHHVVYLVIFYVLVLQDRPK